MTDAANKTFDDITSRLDEIVETVRAKDTSLERSLDLFDEAIQLGSEAVEMVDTFKLSPREEELLDENAENLTEADVSAPEDENATDVL